VLCCTFLERGWWPLSTPKTVFSVLIGGLLLAPIGSRSEFTLLSFCCAYFYPRPCCSVTESEAETMSELAETLKETSTEHTAYCASHRKTVKSVTLDIHICSSLFCSRCFLLLLTQPPLLSVIVPLVAASLSKLKLVLLLLLQFWWEFTGCCCRTWSETICHHVFPFYIAVFVR
jgi:hypothetical protein